MRQPTCEKERMAGARRLSIVSIALAGAAMAPAAEAKDIKLPEGHPEMALQVPDDWSVAPTASGLELTSPEKNAIVVVKVIDKSKAAAEAFAKQSVDVLKGFGVTFAADAKVPAKTPAAATDKVPAKPDKSLSAFQGQPEKFTFTGTPSLALPGTAKSNDPEKTPQNSVEALTGFGATVTGAEKLPLRAAQYFGTTLNGRPVDVQFVLFNPPGPHYFALMQESGADDGRTVAMAQSVKAAK